LKDSDPREYSISLEQRLRKWETDNPGAADYARRVSALKAEDDGVVERARKAAMAELDADGYFDSSSKIGRRYVKASDIPDGDIIDIRARVSSLRKQDKVLGATSFANSVTLYLSQLGGYDPVEIQDVINAGSPKYKNPDRKLYEDTHKKLLLWFDDGARWSDIAGGK
jgi:hypothetical protein